MKRLWQNEGGVSVVTRVVIMVVLLAAIVGGIVVQRGEPEMAPSIAVSLADDASEALADGVDDTGRIASLLFEGGDIVDEGEVRVLAIYRDGGADYTADKDMSGVTAGSAVAMAADRIKINWIDSDGSGNLSPGDRLDFSEGGSNATAGHEVTPATDFTVKLTHKPTSIIIVSETVKVY